MVLTDIFLTLSLILSCQCSPIPREHLHHVHKRGNTCSFPNYDGMVSLSGSNGGWAQSGNCQAGNYCQYACKPGYLMGQWNPQITTYSYPGSQDGGLFCNNNGELEKPISGNSYCYKGKGTANVFNSASQNVALCQTVLPGNEAMLIPTEVGTSSSSPLAVPGTDYWASTAAHYYINPPGVSAEDGCQWGSTDNPWGNWSPYVAGVNMDDSGNTFAKIGWNPVYFEDSSPFKNQKPNFGVRIKCTDSSKCSGSTCEINPKKYGIDTVSAGGQSMSDGAAWCVLTATQNSGITLEVFDV